MYMRFAVFYLDEHDNFRENSFVSCSNAMRFAGTLIKEHGDIFHRMYYIEYGDNQNYTYTHGELKTLLINAKAIDEDTLMELYL